MQLVAEQLMELVEAAVNIRNECKMGMAAKDHLIQMPATAATATAPARAAWVKDTGQLANAANNAFVLANNLIGHMRLIGVDDATIKKAEALLNAAAPVATGGSATGQQATASQPSAPAPATAKAGQTTPAAAKPETNQPAPSPAK